jgi:phage head maturation protease
MQMLSEKQIAIADSLNAIVTRFGPFEQGDDANGCDYRDGESNRNHAGKCCAECVFYRGGGCSIVNGTVDAMGICRFWIISDQTLEESEYEDGMESDDASAETETDEYEDEMKAVLSTAQRNKLPDSDFVFPNERSFPIVDASDVQDAVSSWGRYRGPESFETFKKRLTALAKRKNFGDALPDSWKTDEMAKSLPSYAIKSVSVEEQTYRGLGIVFGGRDLVGDQFTKMTDIGASRPFEGMELYYNHADELPEPIGHVTKADIDEAGVWFEFQLSKRHKYIEKVRKLIEIGALGLSTGALPHLVIRDTGELKRWPVGELSVTPNPAEPRTLVHTKSVDDESPSDTSPSGPVIVFVRGKSNGRS